MRAIVQDRYGSPDVLRLEEIDTPAVGDDGVLVRVHAAAIGAATWHLMAGLPYVVRISGYGLRRPRIRVPGTDLAGRVEAVGADVTRFKPGDEVFGECEGSLAEYACAPEDKLMPKPASLTFDQAGAVVDSGHTALVGLRDVAKVQPGQKVLVIGAGGGVGTFAVQIAKALGADVTGVCSTSKTDLVLSLGADYAIDYTREDFADGRRRWDVIFDTAGRRSLSHLRRGLTPRGTLVIVGGEGGGRWMGGTDRQICALLMSGFLQQKLRTFVSMPKIEGLAALAGLLDSGKVTPVIDRTYELSEAPEAIRYWARGHTRGKVVVTV